MRSLLCGVAISFAALATNVSAEVMLTIDGTEYPLSALMKSCQSMGEDPIAQVACFGAVSKLVDAQSGASATAGQPLVPEALDAFRAAAEYQDENTGLSITGSECSVQIVYHNNYFHISRRNVSSIDLFSAQFDASEFDYNTLIEVPGSQAPLYEGSMNDGSTAAAVGDLAMESSQYDFDAKSPRVTIGEYAAEVADQLVANESRDFNFVLVHPQKSQSRTEIESVFKAYIDACQ